MSFLVELLQPETLIAREHRRYMTDKGRTFEIKANSPSRGILDIRLDNPKISRRKRRAVVCTEDKTFNDDDRGLRRFQINFRRISGRNDEVKAENNHVLLH